MFSRIPLLALCFLLPAASIAGGEGRPFPDGETITLEQAYDRTLESDQTIRIAFLEVRKANLLPWSALTRLQHQFTIRETLYGVASAYYEVLKQQRLVYVNRETFRLAREQFEIARI